MVLEDIFSLFDQFGHSEYGGESVTQLEHALQCAQLAQQHGAAPALIASALLHDVGHLLHELPDDAPDRGIDDYHENLAAQYLSKHFGPEVTEPIRLHVAAKRYLCSTEPEYLEALSEPSRVSLALQGGLMTPEEQAAFVALPFAHDAVLVRRWDDTAKVPGLPTPNIRDYAEVLNTVILSEHKPA
jgi:phosphonate degradation associated HDIG domain protein